MTGSSNTAVTWTATGGTISTGGLFMLAGILHERRHTYEISEFGGLKAVMPRLPSPVLA